MPGRPADRPGRMSAYPRNQPPAPALPISATVICKNEEACIGKCLSSLEGLSEIVVVDSGSTDGTLVIVEDHSAPRASDPAHPSTLARLRRPEAVRPRSGARTLDSQHRRRRMARRRLRAALPRLIAADEAIAGWELRRTLTLYGSLKPASLWTRPEHILRLVRRGRASFRRLPARSRGPDRRGRDGDRPQRPPAP